MRIRVGWFVAVIALTALATGCSAPTPPVETTPSVSQPSDAPPSAVGFVDCYYEAAGQPSRPVDPPPTTTIPAIGQVEVTLEMDAGDLVMTLDRAGAPCAVNSLVSLVSQGFLDDTTCHRLVPGFVLQCGDPTATSRGGPGYRFADELTGWETYPYATVAMANSGPNTNGSQFFIVIGSSVQLPPAYVVLGQVNPEAMAVFEAIAALGVDPSDPEGIRPLEGGHIQQARVG